MHYKLSQYRFLFIHILRRLWDCLKKNTIGYFEKKMPMIKLHDIQNLELNYRLKKLLAILKDSSANLYFLKKILVKNSTQAHFLFNIKRNLWEIMKKRILWSILSKKVLMDNLKLKILITLNSIPDRKDCLPLSKFILQVIIFQKN